MDAAAEGLGVLLKGIDYFVINLGSSFIRMIKLF